ncbi:MAG: hypothetical protein J6D42_05980 [Clostridia bacterium]|nr:hypothetical protein [Clostridia bacterium]
MSDKRTAVIVNLIMGTFFLVLSAVLFAFSGVYAKTPRYMSFAEDRIVYSVVLEDKYESVDKDSLYTAEDYIGLTLYRTPSGKKWHLTKECKYLRSSKKIIATDYQAAVSAGLSACTNCGYPDKHYD